MTLPFMSAMTDVENRLTPNADGARVLSHAIAAGPACDLPKRSHKPVLTAQAENSYTRDSTHL